MRQVNKLQATVDNLDFPEKGRWVDISANVSLFQSAAVAATVNYAEVFVENNKATVLVRLTASAAGTPANNIYILLPVRLTPISGISVNQPLGTAIYQDTGSNHFQGIAAYVAVITGLPAIAMFEATTNNGNAIGTTPAVTIASGDEYGIDLTFEIA